MAYKIWLYYEWEDSINWLSLEDKGKILENIFSYSIRWEIIHNWYIQIIFQFMKNRFDIDKENYENKCQKNKEIGKLGWRPKKTFNNQTVITETQTVISKPNSNSNSILPKGNNIYPSDFETFWKAYPIKKWKAEWYKAYKEAIKKTTPEIILSWAIKYSEECISSWTKYIKRSQWWLNNQRREDEETPTDINTEFTTLTPKAFAEKYGYDKRSEMNNKFLLGE